MKLLDTTVVIDIDRGGSEVLNKARNHLLKFTPTRIFVNAPIIPEQFQKPYK